MLLYTTNDQGTASHAFFPHSVQCHVPHNSTHVLDTLDSMIIVVLYKDVLSLIE